MSMGEEKAMEQSIPLTGLGFSNNHNNKDQLDHNVKSRKPKHYERRWKHVWFDFTQATTIHGINKVTEDQPFTLRRLIWLALVLGGMALFVNQFVSSIIRYLSWPVTVNVKVNYNDTLVFPAITLCNQNVFRTTAAADAGRYELIQAMYENTQPPSNLSQFASAYNISLDDLYRQAAHTKEDMIIECMWDNKPCSSSNFSFVMTDHGPCFTFNHAKFEEPLKVEQTGANRGLQLRVNIEQYEYMPGPNMAAGLKLLIHDQDEVPLVRDLGQAVPPGFHAFAGISILQIINLPHPHGKCDDSKDLEYFDRYSVSGCSVDCASKYLLKRCGCRQIHTPELSPGYPPVCTIGVYYNCTLPVLAEFNELQNPCACPVPCSRTMYDPTLTYGSISNFDTANLLKSNLISNLSSSYIRAREVSQRVDKSIVKSDTELISYLERSVFEVDEVLENMTELLDKTLSEASGIKKYMFPRVFFHWDRGLDEVKYFIEHNFIRGYDVMKERTLGHVATGYHEFFTAFEKLINETLSSDIGDMAFRDALLAIIDRDLYTRSDLILRALSNMSKLHNAYANAEPLLRFRSTIDRRYDHTYLDKEMVTENKDELTYYQKWDRYTRQLLEQLHLMKAIAYQAHGNNTIDWEHFRKVGAMFEKRSRSYNYYLFMYGSRVITNPQTKIDAKIDIFLKLNETLVGHFKELDIEVEGLNTALRELKRSSFVKIQEAVELANDYLKNKSLLKTQVAERLTSKNLAEMFGQVKRFFVDIQSRARSVKGLWARIWDDIKTIWMNMVNEPSTKAIYEMMYNDTHDYLANRTEREDLVRFLASMLRISRDKLRELTPEEVLSATNGDFFTTNLEMKLNETSEYFMDVYHRLDILNAIHGKDEQFYDAFNSVQKTMSEFLRGNEIDVHFFRTNFLQMDVFMKDLSYQEIEQQKAYEMTNLWSDIGGSMGLFIGASVITLCEVLDVILHTLAKRHFLSRPTKS